MTATLTRSTGAPAATAGPLALATRRLKSMWPSLTLVVVLLALWELIGRTVLDGRSVMPPPTEIAGEITGNWSSYTTHIRATAIGAAWGWLWGNGIAIAVGLLTVAVPAIEKWALRIAVAITSLPIIALGPIFQVTLDGSAPKIALAALAVVLSTLVGTIQGLHAADRTSLEVVAALGGGRITQLRKVRLMSTLPPLFTALRISAPAAVLGTIIGEFLGRVETGLGVALINAQRNVQTERVWGVAIIATAVAGLGYLLIAAVGRALTSWAPKEQGR